MKKTRQQLVEEFREQCAAPAIRKEERRLARKGMVLSPIERRRIIMEATRNDAFFMDLTIFLEQHREEIEEETE